MHHIRRILAAVATLVGAVMATASASAFGPSHIRGRVPRSMGAGCEAGPSSLLSPGARCSG